MSLIFSTEKTVNHLPLLSKIVLIFLKRWLKIFEKNYELIDDSPSKIKNHIDFVENRHDQSVFSLLCKINKIFNISAYECDWVLKRNKRYWGHLSKSPIIAKRDLRYGIFRRFINRQKKNLNRFFKK